MKMYREEAREIPVAAQVDVLVLGAGPAGFSAAVCAARQGANTLLVEQGGDVGGIATSGLMSHWTGTTQGGFYEEILDRSADCRGGKDLGFNGSERNIINPERLKTVMLQMLEEAGAHLRLYTFASGVVMEGSRLRGVIVESKSGRQLIEAKIVIDCTGDGDIAAKTGAAYTKGREGDGAMQPVSIMFKVGGVDYSRAIFPGGFEEEIEIPGKGGVQALGKKKLPFPAGHVLLYRSTLPGVVTCNMTNCIGIDGTSADDLTHATLICRSQIEPITAFLRENVPGYEACYVVSSASLIGVRETRHFKGLATITEQDILSARVFDDWAVTKACFNFDVHNMTGNGLDATGSQKNFTQTKGYTIPYGCLVPEKIDGLLLAGRDISGTHLAHANYRVMPICANMGQAAGIAAALCVEHNIQPRALDVALLQKELIAQGVTP
ncbi:MAG: FAD-dependent oxidoreductase [Faecalibacterium sp.]|jgi:hypothetical protein|nr:FAD-dependent oxidoreductase [Faecalibacterium sp.]